MKTPEKKYLFQYNKFYKGKWGKEILKKCKAEYREEMRMTIPGFTNKQDYYEKKNYI